MKRILILFISIFTLIPTFAQTQEEIEGWSKNLDLYTQGNHTEAVKWRRKAAEQGDAEAQYNLGGCYYEGWGVPKNKAVGIKWMKKAAQQGNEYAKNFLESIGETW